MAGCQHSRLLQCYQRSVWYSGGVLHSQDMSCHVSRTQGNVLCLLISIWTTLRSRIASVVSHAFVTCICHKSCQQSCPCSWPILYVYGLSQPTYILRAGQDAFFLSAQCTSTENVRYVRCSMSIYGQMVSRSRSQHGCQHQSTSTICLTG